MPGDVSSFLFQGAAPVPAPSGSDVSTGGPLWLQTALYNLTNAAGGVAGQPYTPFPGPQVAQPSSTTQRAWGMANQNAGSWSPYLQQAGALNNQAAQPITQTDVNQYLNPMQGYITGALNRNLMRNLLPQIQDRFVSAGQSRSPQEAQMTSDAIYGTQQAAGQATAQNYQGALNAAFQQQQNLARSAGFSGQLGTLTAQLGAGDVGQLAAAGQAQDTSNQANINAALGNFYRQQNWPYQQLGFLSDITRGIPLGAAGQTTQTVNSSYLPPSYYGASPLSSFANNSQMFSGMGYRRGGAVPMRDRGALSHYRLAA